MIARRSLAEPAEESRLSVFGRRFWWPACLTPPLLLLFCYDNARRTQSADENGVALGLVWVFVLFLAGAVLVIGAAVSRTLSSREKSFLSVLGISPAALGFLLAYFDSQIAWNKPSSPRGIAACLLLTAVWVILALWFRRAAWPATGQDPSGSGLP